jgi:hypothetical protein
MAEVTSVQTGGNQSSANSPANTAAARYKQLEQDREPFLRQAKAASELTVPTLIHDPGVSSDQLRKPFQSVGARGVNNLASKLLLALLPPNQAFYKEEIDEMELGKIRNQIEQSGANAENLLAELQQALSQIESAVVKEAEGLGLRVHLFEGLKHGIVAGNFLLVVPTLRPNDPVRIFHLDRYVVQRDPNGTLLELIIKETVAVSTLTKKLLDSLKNSDGQVAGQYSESGQTSGTPLVDVYTYVRLEDSTSVYKVFQEIGGKVIEGTQASYPKDRLPFIAVRFIKRDGDDYGHGYVADYEGDLLSLESLSESLVKGSAAAARVIFLVQPNGTTKLSKIAKAENGAVIEGNAEDVSTLQMDKFADFSVVRQEKADIEARLKEAFLLNSSIQRQAERVTAEEIRFMARELEDSLGGIYSLLAADLQMPLVKLLKFRMQSRGKLPKLPSEIVSPRIVTGFDALGRGHDLEKLDIFLGSALQLFGPSILQYIDASDYLMRRAAALALNTQGLIKSKEQVQQEQQQQSALAMAQKVGPNAVNKIGDMVLNQQQQQQTQNAE